MPLSIEDWVAAILPAWRERLAAEVEAWRRDLPPAVAGRASQELAATLRAVADQVAAPIPDVHVEAGEVEDEADRYLEAAAVGDELGRTLVAMIECWRDDHFVPAMVRCRAQGIGTLGIADVLANLLKEMALQMEQLSGGGTR